MPRDLRSDAIGAASSPADRVIALRVADVAEARAKLEAEGVEFPGEILDTGVCHMAFFAIPTGTR